MKMNKENLLRLADYLMNGNYKAVFDMSKFSNLNGICSSVGCAIGHSTLIGFKKKVDEG